MAKTAASAKKPKSPVVAPIGVFLAILLRRLDIPPRARYSWEGESDECEDGAAGVAAVKAGTPSPRISAFIGIRARRSLRPRW